MSERSIENCPLNRSNSIKSAIISGFSGFDYKTDFQGMFLVALVITRLIVA